jgi:hypothetical protein
VPAPPGSLACLQASHTVTQSHRKWAEAKRKHGAPVGTAFTYKLNAPATVALTFTRKLAGHKVKGKCVTSAKQKHGPRCTTAVPAGTLTRAAAAGTTTVAFSGKLGAKKLAPGTYTVTVTARIQHGYGHRGTHLHDHPLKRTAHTWTAPMTGPGRPRQATQGCGRMRSRPTMLRAGARTIGIRSPRENVAEWRF